MSSPKMPSPESQSYQKSVIPLDPEEAKAEFKKENIEELSIDEVVNHSGFGRYQYLLLVVSVLAWMSDGMTPIIISYLLDGKETVLETQSGFRVGQVERILLASSLFIGMFFGSIVWGKLSDIKGRRNILFWTVGLTFLFSIVAALSPWVEFLIFAEVVLGFAVGGNLPVVYSLFIEFTPMTNRGFWLTVLASSWSIGELLVSFFAWLLLENEYFGWRGLVALTGAPGLVTIAFWWWVYESPRFLTLGGHKNEAQEILEKVLVRNKRPYPEQWNLKPQKSVDQNELGSLMALFAPGIRRQTIFLWFSWLFASVGLYGILIYLPTLLTDKGLSGTVEITFISGAGNIPGIIAGALLVETRLQRRKTMALMAILTAIFTALLVPNWSKSIITIVATFAKFGLYGFWAVLDGYTPESYPTTIRSISNSAASSLARISGFVSPPLNQVLLSETGTSVPILVWATAMFFVSIISLILPIETADMVLSQSIDNIEKNNISSDNNRLIDLDPDESVSYNKS